MPPVNHHQAAQARASAARVSPGRASKKYKNVESKIVTGGSKQSSSNKSGNSSFTSSSNKKQQKDDILRGIFSKIDALESTQEQRWPTQGAAAFMQSYVEDSAGGGGGGKTRQETEAISDARRAKLAAMQDDTNLRIEHKAECHACEYPPLSEPVPVPSNWTEHRRSQCAELSFEDFCYCRSLFSTIMNDKNTVFPTSVTAASSSSSSSSSSAAAKKLSSSSPSASIKPNSSFNNNNNNNTSSRTIEEDLVSGDGSVLIASSSSPDDVLTTPPATPLSPALVTGGGGGGTGSNNNSPGNNNNASAASALAVGADVGFIELPDLVQYRIRHPHKIPLSAFDNLRLKGDGRVFLDEFISMFFKNIARGRLISAISQYEESFNMPFSALTPQQRKELRQMYEELIRNKDRDDPTDEKDLPMPGKNFAQIPVRVLDRCHTSFDNIQKLAGHVVNVLLQQYTTGTSSMDMAMRGSPVAAVRALSRMAVTAEISFSDFYEEELQNEQQRKEEANRNRGEQVYHGERGKEGGMENDDEENERKDKNRKHSKMAFEGALHLFEKNDGSGSSSAVPATPASSSSSSASPFNLSTTAKAGAATKTPPSDNKNKNNNKNDTSSKLLSVESSPFGETYLSVSNNSLNPMMGASSTSILSSASSATTSHQQQQQQQQQKPSPVLPSSLSIHQQLQLQQQQQQSNSSSSSSPSVLFSTSNTNNNNNNTKAILSHQPQVTLPSYMQPIQRAPSPTRKRGVTVLKKALGIAEMRQKRMAYTPFSSSFRRASSAGRSRSISSPGGTSPNSSSPGGRRPGDKHVLSPRRHQQHQREGSVPPEDYCKKGNLSLLDFFALLIESEVVFSPCEIVHLLHWRGGAVDVHVDAVARWVARAAFASGACPAELSYPAMIQLVRHHLTSNPLASDDDITNPLLDLLGGPYLQFLSRWVADCQVARMTKGAEIPEEDGGEAIAQCVDCCPQCHDRTTAVSISIAAAAKTFEDRKAAQSEAALKAMITSHCEVLSHPILLLSAIVPFNSFQLLNQQIVALPERALNRLPRIFTPAAALNLSSMEMFRHSFVAGGKTFDLKNQEKIEPDSFVEELLQRTRHDVANKVRKIRMMKKVQDEKKRKKQLAAKNQKHLVREQRKLNGFSDSDSDSDPAVSDDDDDDDDEDNSNNAEEKRRRRQEEEEEQEEAEKKKEVAAEQAKLLTEEEKEKQAQDARRRKREREMFMTAEEVQKEREREEQEEKERRRAKLESYLLGRIKTLEHAGGEAHETNSQNSKNASLKRRRRSSSPKQQQQQQKRRKSLVERRKSLTSGRNSTSPLDDQKKKTQQQKDARRRSLSFQHQQQQQEEGGGGGDDESEDSNNNNSINEPNYSTLHVHPVTELLKRHLRNQESSKKNIASLALASTRRMSMNK